jgi:hypothetical protein
VSFSHIVRVLDLVVHQGRGNDYFNLIGGKEATRTSVSAGAKRQARRANAHEMAIGNYLGGLGSEHCVSLGLSELVETESVKNIWVIEDGGV